MKLTVISSEKILFEGEVDTINAPTISGRVGILSNHVNMVSALDIGEMIVEIKNEKKQFILNGGFIEVKDNEVIVLANEAAIPQEIVKKEIEEAIKRAEEQISSGLPPQELILLEKQLRYERLKLKEGRD